MSIMNKERRQQRRVRIAKLRWKWLKGNCRHVCRWCKYRKICDV